MQRSGESIFLTIQFMVMGEGYHYESLRERWGTPWSEWSTIAGLTHRDRQPRLLTFKHTANLRLSVNLTSMSLDWGRKLENPGTMQRMQTPHRRTPAGQQVTMWNLFAVRQKSKPPALNMTYENMLILLNMCVPTWRLTANTKEAYSLVVIA